MMAQINISIRMDDQLKQQFDLLCDDMGLSMTAAFTIFAKAVVREERIPFELTATKPSHTENKGGEPACTQQ